MSVVSNVIVSLFLAAMAAGAAQPPGITRVIGRVIDDQAKTPVAGATVVLQLVSRTPQPVSLGPLNAQTNDSGEFSLDVPSGRYRVLVNEPGFVRLNGSSPSLNRPISGRMVNLGDIRLTLGGVVEGRVFDANGTPMPGLSVTIVAPGLNVRSRNEVGSPVGTSAQTNDLGAFRVTGVPAGKYYVGAQQAWRGGFNRQAFADVTFVNTYYPGSASPGSARLVEVAPGKTTNGIDFRLIERATVTASGIVVDKRGLPIDAAMVSFRLDGDRLARPITVIARADGTFTVALADGRYRVEASRPIMSVTANTRSVTYEGGSKSVKVRIDGRPVTGIKVRMER